MSKPKIEARLRDKLRLGHYSIHTEKAYVDWYLRFVRFHGLRHPEMMGAPELEAFLTDMANRGVSASTQNQALCAIVFLYERVLGIDLGDFSAMRARRSKHVPVVLIPEEVKRVLVGMRMCEPVQPW